jgi:hypothetical protein
VSGPEVTYVPLPLTARTSHTTHVITNVIVHLLGEMPILCDLEAVPQSGDRSIRCTNVRTIDGKRPAFVHDPHDTFVMPLSTIRVIELPADGTQARADVAQPATEQPVAAQPAPAAAPEFEDDEPDEDLLARIRSV